MTRLERTVIVLALLLGGLLRAPGLAREPLGADEAAHAWRAARAATAGEVVAEGVTNPFLASAQAALFLMVEPETFLARLPPLLCGLALLFVPLLVRGPLGTIRTTALVVLLAIDPALVRIARDGSGAAAAVLAGALAIAGLLRWRHDGRADAAAGRRWAVITSAALGALVTSGPQAWSMAALAGLAAIALRPARACPARSRHCAAAFLGSALLTSTAGLWAIPWAAGVSASLTVWLSRLFGPFEAASLLDVLRSGPLAVLLALVGLSRAPRAAIPALLGGVLLAAWTPGAPALLALVLAVCAAHGATALVEREARLTWLGPFAIAGVLAAFVQLASAARPLAAPASEVAAAAARVPDLETLASDLERIAVLRGREAHELPVRVLAEPADPALGWALRRGRNVLFEPVRPREETGPRTALVAPAGDPPAPAPSGYVGSTYASPRGKVNLWVPIEP